MIGLIVIGALALYAFMAWMCVNWVRSLVGSRPKKVAITIILWTSFIVVPIADDLAGRWKFEQLCTREAGVTVHRKISGVDGFLGNQHGNEFVQRFGYEFVEYEEKPGYLSRFFRDQEKGVQKEAVRISASRYRVQTRRISFDRHVGGVRDTIEEIATGQVLATNTALYYEGGWLQRTLAHAGGGTGYTCPDSQSKVDHYAFVTSVIAPVKRN